MPLKEESPALVESFSFTAGYRDGSAEYGGSTERGAGMPGMLKKTQ